MSGSSSTFAGLRIQDREGKKLATVVLEVSRRGVRLEGKKGTLGNFPFQSIGSWTRASARSLGLVVAANNAQREVILHADDPKLVDAVLTAIDTTVQAILHEMSSTPGGSAAMSTENQEATYATPDASSGSEGDAEGAGASSSSPAEVSSTGGGGGDGSQMTRTESVAKMRAAAADKKRREAENRAVLAERDLAAAEKEVAELRARLAAGGGDGGSDAVGTLASDLKVAQLEEELRNVSAQLDRAIERQDAVSERERRVSAREQAVAEAELEDVEAEADKIAREEAASVELAEERRRRTEAERALEASAEQVERLRAKLDEQPEIIPATPQPPPVDDDGGRVAELERARDEWRRRAENLSEELERAKAAAVAAARVSEALAAKAATPIKSASTSPRLSGSYSGDEKSAPGDETLRAEALQRAADAERELAAAREETREARRQSKDSAWRADVAEEKAKVAEGRAAAAEARARQTAAAAEAAGALNLETAGVEAKAELVEVKSRLRAVEAALESARGEVKVAREEADSARAAAAQLSASAATNAAAAAAYYSAQGASVDRLEADARAKDASAAVFSRMAADATDAQTVLKRCWM